MKKSDDEDDDQCCISSEIRESLEKISIADDRDEGRFFKDLQGNFFIHAFFWLGRLSSIKFRNFSSGFLPVCIFSLSWKECKYNSCKI